jgi:hypothetical protein
MSTLVVMYTLKRHGKYLLGPINRWMYASFAVKKHAFAIAKREASKRGFGPDSGKLVQIVTDGDLDLACYAKEFFPDAIHTVDVMHVLEKLWSAGECLHREGSKELQKWFDTQRDKLYDGKVGCARKLCKVANASASKPTNQHPCRISSRTLSNHWRKWRDLGRSAPNSKRSVLNLKRKLGAKKGTRTPDLLITKLCSKFSRISSRAIPAT